MKSRIDFAALLFVLALILNFGDFWFKELKPIIWTALKIWAGKDVAF